MTTVDAGNAAAQRMGATGADLLLVLILVGSLVAKEVTTSVPDPRARLVGRILDVVLAPLLMVYGLIVAVNLLQVWK
jgi:hypothetical protein